MNWPTILVVDDEKNTREGLKPVLTAMDYDVLLAESGKEALELIKDHKPDVALIDLRMPDMDGMTLLHQIKNQYQDTAVIILTAYGTVESAVQAMKAGAYYYLTKPINFDELELILKKALYQKELELENASLKAELLQERHEEGTIIGRSLEIRQMIALAEKVAKTQSTVLIQGESGTGKELFAHLIHRESERKDKPFIAVHMAALTDTLLASELFGHERGAFTGATERKIGRFERADGGTLFLDEVSEIPEIMQTKLLRVLQTGEFERVGGTKTIKSDVRLICATNKNLKEEVRAGRFREDLYYRINVILLEIPPLRKRPQDIPLLAEHYLKHFNIANRKKIKAISKDALECLKEYSWPGNVRELKNIIERAVVLANSEMIETAQLPDDIKNGSHGIPLFSPGQANLSRTTPNDQTIRSMEKDMIKNALGESSNNKSLVAKKLGISRRTLYRKLKEYKISD